MSPLAATLHAALEKATPALPDLISALEPTNETASELEEDALEQFLRAFVMLMHEGIDGGREQRELVMATAVPALVAAGQSPEQLVRSHVAFFMAVQAAMLEAIGPAERSEASLWLADYAAGYTCEVLEAAQRA